MAAGVHPAAASLVPAEEGEGGSSTPRLSARPSLGPACSCHVSEQPQVGHSRKAEQKKGEADKLGAHRHVPEPHSPWGTHPPTGTQQLLKHYTWKEEALAHTYTRTHIRLLSVKKTLPSDFRNTHRHMHTHLTSIQNSYWRYFLQALFYLEVNSSLSPSSFPSAAYCLLSRHSPCASFLVPSHTSQKSLSQPAAASHHCKPAASRSSSAARWHSQERCTAAGVGPRWAQSSLSNDICEQDFFMKN